MEGIELREQSESSSAEDMSPDHSDDADSTTSSSSGAPDSFKAKTGKPSRVTPLNINPYVSDAAYDVVSSTVVNIPNAEKIRAAKEQRRRARAQRDYLPLDADEESEAELGDGAPDESDRDHGSDDEPDDHERRIQFAPKPKTLRERMTEKMGKNWKLELDPIT